MKNIFLIILGLLFCQQSWAQNGDHCVAFRISMPESQAELSAENLRSLELKCNQIITRSNAARTSLYGMFVLIPHIDILDQRTVMAGTEDITVVEGELTLIAQNSIDNSQYGSVTVRLEGSGKSQAKALNNLFQSINPTMPSYVKFIKHATSQIVDYYNDNMPRVLSFAQTLINAKQYQDAADLLCYIPFCVPAFAQSQDAINELLKTLTAKNCSSAIEIANRYIAIENYEVAKEILLSVEPGIECDEKIQELLKIIKDKQSSKSASNE